MRTKAPQIGAQQIVTLLAAKHSADVFVPECKDGPTQRGSHRRLDAWAMNRSWANATVYGYEVKVSRGDFLGDEKWTSYLEMCNCLSFVCPRGLIAPEELPQDVGLLWVSKTGGKLFTKRKAAHRDVEIPESVWRYILMCRATITRETSAGSSSERWKHWLRQKRANADLGWEVRGRIREVVEQTNRENARLKKQMEGYDGFKKKLEAAGIDVKAAGSTWSQDEAIKRLRGQQIPDLLKALSKLEWPLSQLTEALQEEMR